MLVSRAIDMLLLRAARELSYLVKWPLRSNRRPEIARQVADMFLHGVWHPAAKAE
jgi:hypothetical protein